MDEKRPINPPCLSSMGCLCALHARSFGSTRPCDTTEHHVTIETMPGRRRAPPRSRFRCSCGATGSVTTPGEADAESDRHLASDSPSA